MMDWTTIVVSAIGGGGLLTGVVEVIKSVILKKKTPYDMLMDMLAEQKKFYQERNADYEREKMDSAEKSSVIMQSHFCRHRFKDPDTPCPVDTANDERLKKRCERCSYTPIEPDLPDSRPPRFNHRNAENEEFD